MSRGPVEEPDLRLADELIFAQRGLRLQRFSPAETGVSRTPDFRVIRAGEAAAFCEVKSPRDSWLEEQIAAVPPGQNFGGGGPDPVFNRLARHIQKAAKQFDAVNQDRLLPNILVLVNHDDGSGYEDLREVLTGTLHAESGTRYITMPHIAEGLIGHAKRRIDLYAWIDDPPQRPPVRFHFSLVIPAHVTALCRLLKLPLPRTEISQGPMVRLRGFDARGNR